MLRFSRVTRLALDTALPLPSSRRFLPSSRRFCAAASAAVAPSNPADEMVLPESSLLAALKPSAIVAKLDEYIVGQADAKRAVAIALRNRWRRHQLPDDLKNEVIPKNILMVGPTGCGKTEIARRIAKLSQAPFIKVEATKFTEVGFHGKDVDQIIRDLLEISRNMTRKRLKDAAKADIAEHIEEVILSKLLGDASDEQQRSVYREMLRQGSLNDQMVEIDLPAKSNNDNKGMDSIGNVADLFNMGRKMEKRAMERKKMAIKDAYPALEEVETERIIDDVDINKEAIAAVEESGIVFIDEIDKLVSGTDHRGADASSEGVQRDLLPLIEGTVVSTKHGNVNTDFILFICSGAFHSCKPGDLMSELQGRLPIKVNLVGLTEDDLYRILTEPVTNLVRQAVELIKTEKVDLVFTDKAIREMARIASEANKNIENIGARRLHGIIEKVIEEESFNACEYPEGHKIVVDEVMVTAKVKDLLKTLDLSKYVL